MIHLQGTTTGDKNEILWQHNVNYQNLPEQFKKVSGHSGHVHEPASQVALCT